MIRPATADDTPELGKILVAAFRSGYQDLLAPAILADLDPAEWSAVIANGIAVGALCTVVWQETGGPIAGFATFGPDPADPGIGYLASLYVDPNAAGAGVGRQLLSHVVDQLIAAGHHVTELWVFEGNERATRLYERAGFHATDRTHLDPRWGIPQRRYSRYSTDLD